MSGTPARYRMSSPPLGQHNDVVYGTLGLDDDSLARLGADAVI